MKNLYFAMHCQTARNKNDTAMDEYLKQYTDYDEQKTPPGQEVGQSEQITGQLNPPLIYKGRKQAELLAVQLLNADKNREIKHILCAEQDRCIETGTIIGEILQTNGYDIHIYTDSKLNSRGYGKLAEENMDPEKLAHFYYPQASIKNTMHTIKTALQYKFTPQKLHIESHTAFQDRVAKFFEQNQDSLDNTLIVASSEIYRLLEKSGSKFTHYEDTKLHRGELAQIDQLVIKNVMAKSNEKSLERTM